MAIAITNTPSTDTATQTGTGSSLTISSVTVAAGEVLYVISSMRDGGTTTTGVTWNGSENMSLAVRASGTSYYSTSIWELSNPTATTANIVVTYGASRDRPKIATAYTLSGVDTAVMTEATGVNGDYASTDLTVSVTSLTDNALILDAAFQVSDGTNPTITKDADQTQTINQEVQGTYGGRFGQSYKTLATAGATTMTWTSSNSLAATNAVVAIAPEAEAGVVKTRNTVAVANIQTVNTVS